MNDNEKRHIQQMPKTTGPGHEIQPDDLHDLIGSSAEGDAEDPLAQYRNDPNYAELIKDLEYIAWEAKKYYFPDQEAPRDELWTKIETAFASETKEPKS